MIHLYGRREQAETTAGIRITANYLPANFNGRSFNLDVPEDRQSTEGQHAQAR